MSKDKSKYVIGFYESGLETPEEEFTKHCDKVYYDIEKLYSHLRLGDIVLFNSPFSLALLDSQRLREKVNEFDLKVIILGAQRILDFEDNSNAYGRLVLNMLLGIFDWIKEYPNEIEKLTKMYKEGE